MLFWLSGGTISADEYLPVCIKVATPTATCCSCYLFDLCVHQDVKLHPASFALIWIVGQREELFCGEFARSASKCWRVQLSSMNYFGLVTFLPWARIASWACLLANSGFNGQSKHVTRQVYTAAQSRELQI